MRAYVTVSSAVLSQFLFGENEVQIVGVAMFESGPKGRIQFYVDANPDLIGHRRNANLTVEYKTEPHIVSRTIKVLP